MKRGLAGNLWEVKFELQVVCGGKWGVHVCIQKE